MSTEESRRAVVGLIRRGVAVIPVPAGHKNPNRLGWQNEHWAEEDVPELWNNGQGVGILWGEPSGGLVDIDCDWPESWAVAAYICPRTRTFGRSGAPRSHFVLRVAGQVPKTKRYKIPGEGDDNAVVELLSTGTQSLVPPSMHDSGERREWYDERAAAQVGEAECVAIAADIATAALLVRHWPGVGSRHDYVNAATGYIGRNLSRARAERVMHAAIRASGDEEATSRGTDVRDTLDKLHRGEATTGGPTLEQLAPGVVDQLRRWHGWGAQDGGQERGRPEEKEARKPTQAELLIQCASGAQLFHTPEGNAYAKIRVGGYLETHPVRSKGFRRWVVREFFTRYDRPPGAQALQDALGLLEARAQFDGPQREVHVRIAEHSGNIYVDLANERWEAVEITPVGWRVVSEPPVEFRRPRGMLPLPAPSQRGGVEELRRFINIREEDQASWRLLLTWLLQALRPKGPYPVLILQGEQGSAKSTVERLLRALVDPSTAPLRTTPRNERDLIIAATNSWCAAFDNISNLPPWLSDAYCRLSTGGGFSARELYTDAEEVLFDTTRPVILNGITDVATRPDLLDRGLIVTLPPIPEEKRRPEAELWRDFEKARPAILGALFDAVSGALGAVESVRLEGMPRMADFAVWATAAEESLRWEPGAFMEAYTGNRREATESALEADPVAATVREFMRDKERWAGTATELWKVLSALVDEDVRHSKAWPGAPNSLTNRLKRLAPALRGIGIEYGEERSGSKGTRLKTLTKKVPAKDRQSRQDRQSNEEALQNRRNATDDTEHPTDDADSPLTKHRQHESPANERVADSSDDTDDVMRPRSKQGHWPGDPMRHYNRGVRSE